MIDGVLFMPLLLVIVIAVLGFIAERTALPSPPIMVLGGSALAFLPGLPTLHATPEIVLLVFLPPLLYSAGVGMSWRGFRSNKRPIALLAVGSVLFTAIAVAAVAHYALHVEWDVGFVLGAVVSAPDAVPVLALLRNTQLPRRIITILEGESLVNDATALVLLAFALDAVATGNFSLANAVVKFVAICAGEVAYGVALGWLILRLRRSASSPRAEVLLALATPYLAFWPPHAIGGSGVIACVAVGLYVSWNGRRFISPETRLQGYFIWDLVVWTTESMIFLVGGLQAGEMLAAFRHAGWERALHAGILVTATIVIARFASVFPAAWLPRLIPSIRRIDPLPPWQFPFLVSFAGLRGVDSLAAALLVPELLFAQPFPERDIILFSTFFAIGVSLFLIGPSFPVAIRWLGMADMGRKEMESNRAAERRIRAEAVDAVVAFLGRKTGSSDPKVSEAIKQFHERRLNDIVASGKTHTTIDPVAESTAINLELLDIERGVVTRAYDENRITDEARRRIERELDLQQAVIKHQRTNSGRSS